MLFRFKSKATGDLIMLEPHGRRILQAMGKDVQAQGIIQVSDMSRCIEAIERDIAKEAEQAQHRKARTQATSGEEAADKDDAAQAVSFKHRALPMLDMLRQCLKAEVPIVWGV